MDMNSNLNNFNYQNVEVKTQSGGKKIVRKVSIKNGKGYKSVTKYNKGKKQGTIKKLIDDTQIQMIKVGKFIPGLFSDCACNKKTRKNRK
jgi:hypothetical protein